MGLKVWLPLNGDLDNKGTANITVTNNGATVNTNGKIGSCYSFDGNDDYINLTSTAINSIFTGGNQEFTVAFWIYHADTTRGIIFGDYSLTGSINLNIELTTNHYLRFYWAGSPDKKFTAVSQADASAWTHLCLAYDGTQIQVYKNGSLTTDSYTGTLATKSKISGSWYLGRDSRTGATALNGRLNDFRIYDYCLSPLEVKEIAQALVCHYKLDGFNAGASENILLGSKSFPTYQAITNQYISKRRSADVYQVRDDGMTEVVTSSPSWGGVSVFANTFNFAPGDILTYSVWAYYSDMTNPTLSFYPMMYNSAGTRDTTTTMPIYLSTGDTWVSANSRSFGNISSATSPKLFWAAFEWTAGMKSIIDNGGRIELTMQSSGTWGSDSKIMLFAPKLEYGYNPNPIWTPALSESGISTTKIVDSSGYGNNGFIVGSPQPIRDSIRHSYCMHFTNTQAARSDRSSTSFLPTEALTLNLWTKMQTWGNPISCTEGGGWNIEYTGGSVNFPVYVKGTGYKHAYTGLPTSFFTDGQWHMITATYDTQYTKIYVDGEYKGQDTTGNIIQYAGTAPLVISGEAENTSDITIGGINSKTMVGEVSDVRIYATVLSEDDIRQLYKVRAKVDNEQNIHTFELDESNSLQISTKGLVQGKELIEDLKAAFYKNGNIEAKNFIET